MSAVQEIINKLKSGEIPKTSVLNIMNENRQERMRGASIKPFKYEWKKKSRILMSLQIAVPFDPETGEVTEEINANCKWRPPISSTEAAQVLKEFAGMNEKSKAMFMMRAGVKEWDTSNSEVLNEKDFEILRNYRVPLVLTVDTISVNDQAITGVEFAQRYTVDIKSDPDTGLVIGELPDVAKLGNMVSAVIFNEIAELKDAIDSKDASKYKGNNSKINKDAIPQAEDKVKKDWNRAIFDTALISSPRPTNFLLGFEYPLSSSASMMDEKGNIIVDYMKTTEEDLKSREVYFEKSKKYSDYISDVLKNPSTDKFWDFVEFDLCDYTPEEPKDQAKALASRDLKPSAPSHGFWSIDSGAIRFPWVNDILRAISDYRSKDPEFERKMAIFLAQKFKPADDILTGNVADHLKTKLPITSRYVDKKILSYHKDACFLVYGDQYIDRLAELGLHTEAVEEKPAGDSETDEKVTGAAALMQELNEEAQDTEATVAEALDVQEVEVE